MDRLLIVITVIGCCFLVFIITIMGISFQNYVSLMNAVSSGDTSMIKSVCLGDWYQAEELKNLPAPCLKFYQK